MIKNKVPAIKTTIDSLKNVHIEKKDLQVYLTKITSQTPKN